MAKNLVIVESPAKVKTIGKFLGKTYDVQASMGHVRDLPKSQIGIDVEHDFEPKYITIRGKGELLASLRKAAKGADKIYLATDPDREGEAISWHLISALNLDPGKIKRITFNEITKTAVRDSLKHPRDIDMKLVDAQQARRVVDRLVGYEISPVLWKKVKRGLSAGRVQSAALHLISEREHEINDFVPKEYWTLEAEFTAKKSGKKLTAKLIGDGNSREFFDEKTVDAATKALETEELITEDIKSGERKKKPPLPFTTSTLQQEAGNALGFSTSKTMRIAQQLYEGVDVKGEGTVGLITYLRTDSTRVSDEAAADAMRYIEEQYGENYKGSVRKDAIARGAQDAHEAIRPTQISRTPVRVKESLSRDQFRLYQLIWNRFAASCMAPAVLKTISLKLKAGTFTFSYAASKQIFAGFRDVYKESGEDPSETGRSIPEPEELSELHFENASKAQHFTQPPSHFTESSLVRTLEERGIGRPSTYAPTISTILARHYITKEQKNLFMTELGEVVDELMSRSFPQIVNADFTANMETLLDGVAEGTVNWKTIVRNFYPDLKNEVDKADAELEKVKVADEVSDIPCEECGRMMVIKYGPHGKFLACPGFPECRNTKPYFEKAGISCPLCGGDVVIRRTRKGRKYYGCSNSPECSFMSWTRPSGKKCPECGSYMVIRGSNLVCSDQSCGYSEKIGKEEGNQEVS